MNTRMPNMHMLLVDPIIADLLGIKLLEASYFFHCLNH